MIPPPQNCSLFYALTLSVFCSLIQILLTAACYAYNRLSAASDIVITFAISLNPDELLNERRPIWIQNDTVCLSDWIYSVCIYLYIYVFPLQSC